MPENVPAIPATAREPSQVFDPSPPIIPDHELIRGIDSGSFGQVWLARSIIGAYRAVKVVRRQMFETERSYEREFNGIKNYEPVSRTHEGLTDLLQVGRNDHAGYYYYVMELCDDVSSGQDIHPDTYKPKTLRNEIKARGKLPFDQCLSLSLSLSSALGHLHKHGLIHRDIKPSNIIFVNDAAKIADIGLVSAIGTSRSFAGTIGYIPPEGFGSIQADIYSLGKVIYEMSTGSDLDDFPTLPTAFCEDQDQARLLELNQVFLKACEADPAKRYKSTADLHADLVLLQSGKSVRRLRVLERRFALMMRLAVVLAVGAASASVLYYEVNKERKRQAEVRAKEAEIKSRQVGSYVAYGTAAMEEGDLLGSLPWFAEAFRLDQANPVAREGHLLRISSGLRLSPKLVQIWFHDHELNTAEFSRDGRLVVTASADGTSQVWDIGSGDLVCNLSAKTELSSASFSPTGELVVTTGTDSTARVWNVASGTEARSISPLVHESEPACARFSPDGDRILTACADGQVRLWNAKTGKPLFSFPAHQKGLLFAEFSPDGNRLATSSMDHTAQVWEIDWEGGMLKPIGQRLRHRNWVYSVAFSPDGRSVVTASFDRTAQVWDAATGSAAGPVLKHPAGVNSARFSPDGRYIVTASFDFMARLWTMTGDPVNPPLRLSGKHVMAASFGPDGHRILTADSHGVTCIWDVAGGKWAPMPASAWFSLNGDRFVNANGRKLEIWNAPGADRIAQVDLGDRTVTDLKLNRDGSRILALTTNSVDADDRQIMAQLFEGSSGGSLAPPFPVGAERPQSILSDDGSHWLSASDKTARFWDAVRGKLLFSPLVHTNRVADLALNWDGSRFATISKGTVFLWDGASGHSIRILPHPGTVGHCEFSPNGLQFVTSCWDGSYAELYAQLWDARDGTPVGGRWQHSDGVRSASFSPDGARVVTASEDTTAQVWDTKTGARLKATLRHKHQVFYAAFSSDSRWIVTAAADGTARVWDAETGEPLTPPLPHSLGDPTDIPVFSQFCNDGRRILTRSDLGATWVWDLPRDADLESDLGLLAGLLSGHQSHAESSILPESKESMRLIWTKLRSRYPATFTVSRDDIVAWHQREAKACEEAGNEPAAAFHRKQTTP